MDVHVCVHRYIKDRGTQRESKRENKGRKDGERETFLPYVPRILGQLVAEYLKDAVYLTCGRQLLTLCCTKTNTHKGTRTGRRTLTHLHTCTQHTHTLHDAKSHGEMLILAYTHTHTNTHTHTHRVQLLER